MKNVLTDSDVTQEINAFIVQLMNEANEVSQSVDNRAQDKLCAADYRKFIYPSMIRVACNMFEREALRRPQYSGMHASLDEVD